MVISRLLLAGASVLALVTEAVSVPVFPLREVEFSDLSVLREETISTAANELTTVGALQITGIPQFGAAREKALKSVGQCLLSDSSAPSVRMGDGKHRVSAAAQTKDGIPGSMSSYCAHESDSLRSAIDGAVSVLLKAMDKYGKVSQNYGRKRRANEFVIEPYRRYADILHSGEHLEHLHSFYDADKSSSLSDSDVPTLNFHTDAGLFIAMTVGYYSDQDGNPVVDEKNGLYMQLQSGGVVEAQAHEDSLIIMVGDGGARWLAPLLGSSLRAVPHSIHVGSVSSKSFSRSWFGKMFLPPADALVPISTRNGEKNEVRYDQYRNLELQYVSSPHDVDSLPSACGHMVGDSRQMSSSDDSSHSEGTYSQLLGNTLCSADDGTGVMCWTQCYSVADLPCGTSAECVDSATGEVVDGNIMCPSDHNNCDLQCVDSSSTSTNETFDDYCWGSGVTMYMSGFKSIVSSKQGKTECINLFFEEWTLDNKSTFAAGCIGVFLLGVFIEFLVFARRKVYSTLPKSLCRDAVLVLLHGVSVALSYFIMLVAMTYNVELFCLAVAGLTIGFVMFNLSEPPRHKTDPCCSLGHEEREDGLVASTGTGSPMQLLNSSDTFEEEFTVEGADILLNDEVSKKIMQQEVMSIPGVNDCGVSSSKKINVFFSGNQLLAAQAATCISHHYEAMVWYQDKATFVIRLEGITCGSCTETVRAAVSRVPGVIFCKAYLSKKLCCVVMNRASLDVAAVVASIEAVGFGATRV